MSNLILKVFLLAGLEKVSTKIIGLSSTAIFKDFHGIEVYLKIQGLSRCERTPLKET